MPKRKNSEVAASDSSDSDDNDEYIIIPNSCYSGSSDSEDCSNDEWSNDNEIVFPNVTYESVVESYTSEQKQLEPNHVYSWIDGEKIYHEDLNNNILLSDKVKKSIVKVHQSNCLSFFSPLTLNITLLKLLVRMV